MSDKFFGHNHGNVVMSAEDQRYATLAAAIVLQSLKDYMGKRLGGSDVSAQDRDSATHFLLSDRCSFMLPRSGISGKELIAAVEQHGLPAMNVDTILGIKRG